jgi:uncharacterized protein with PIN domain
MGPSDHSILYRISYFRFYEELNDFLPAEKRKKDLEYEFSGSPSIKDTIEAIGVPHTEIDLILVDGTSVTFDYKMKGNEYISVYPVFESFDISRIVRLRPKPLRKIKFITDVNVGKLGRKLRLLGFDTMICHDNDDEQIISISINDKRTVLTRDVGLLKHSKLTHGYWIRSEYPFEQIKEVIKRFQLEDCIIPLGRCSVCNGMLKDIDKEKITHHLPEKIKSEHNDFRECENCRKIYWKGSHYIRISEWASELLSC